MKLKEKLSIAGHMVTLEQLETAGPVSLSATSAELKTVPAIETYEALVFGLEGGFGFANQPAGKVTTGHPLGGSAPPVGGAVAHPTMEAGG